MHFLFSISASLLWLTLNIYGFKGKALKLQMKREKTEKNACAAELA
jgi:hypothetical protein